MHIYQCAAKDRLTSSVPLHTVDTHQTTSNSEAKALSSTSPKSSRPFKRCSKLICVLTRVVPRSVVATQPQTPLTESASKRLVSEPTTPWKHQLRNRPSAPFLSPRHPPLSPRLKSFDPSHPLALLLHVASRDLNVPVPFAPESTTAQELHNLRTPNTMLCLNLAVVILLVMTGTAVANRGATETNNCGAPFCKRFAGGPTATESVASASSTTIARAGGS
jgi:hypothetical protein